MILQSLGHAGNEDETSHTPKKLAGYEWWRSIGSPKYVVAPMVDQSELAWRILSRLHGATLAFTPMFHAAIFGQNETYAKSMFDRSEGSLEGVAPYDRPLVVQFCANDKEEWLKATAKVVGKCDAVDLNLGCPQGIAKKGKYGAFLMEEWDLIGDMIDHVHRNLAIPVIAKLRVFPTTGRTIEYASHVQKAGAQLLTVHGRTREAKGRDAGMASWEQIKAVTASLAPHIPIIANGGLPSSKEVPALLEETHAAGVMSAEGNLYNPMIFSPQNAAAGRAYSSILPEKMMSALRACDQQLQGDWDEDLAAYAPATYLAAQYLAIVRTIPSTKTAGSSIKAHLFKLFRPIWSANRHLDLRITLGKVQGVGEADRFYSGLSQYDEFVNQMYSRLQSDLAQGFLPANSYRPLTHQEVVDVYDGEIPYSHAQPYLRINISDNAARPVEETTVTKETMKKRLRSSSRNPDSPVPTGLEAEPFRSNFKSVERGNLSQSVRCSGKAAYLKGFKCPNNAAEKCSNSACSACCKAAGGLEIGVSEAGEGEIKGSKRCDFHLDKRRKVDETQDAKRNAKKFKISRQIDELADGPSEQTEVNRAL